MPLLLLLLPTYTHHPPRARPHPRKYDLSETLVRCRPMPGSELANPRARSRHQKHTHTHTPTHTQNGLVTCTPAYARKYDVLCVRFCQVPPPTKPGAKKTK